MDTRQEMSVERSELKRLYLERLEAFKLYNEWEKAHPPDSSFETVLSCVGGIVEQLDEKDRLRPVDPSGIHKMREALACLKGKPE